MAEEDVVTTAERESATKDEAFSGFITHGAPLAAAALVSHLLDKALGLPAGSLATTVPFLFAMTKF